jgi:hypothetical protein
MVASTGRPRPHANAFVRPRTASASSHRPRWSTGTEAERLRRRTRSSVRVSAGLPIHSQSSPVACHYLTSSLSSLHVPNNAFKCQDRHTEHRCSGAAMDRRPKGNLRRTNGWALSCLIGRGHRFGRLARIENAYVVRCLLRRMPWLGSRSNTSTSGCSVSPTDLPLHSTDVAQLRRLAAAPTRDSPTHRVSDLRDALSRQLLATVINQICDKLQLQYCCVAERGWHCPSQDNISFR